MYELINIGKVFTSKSVGTGPSSYKKRIYLAGSSPRTSSWLMNISINQEALTYSLELMYSTKSCDQAGTHALATTQSYKKQLLAGHFLVGHQLSHRMTHNTHSCCEKTTV